MANFSEDDFIDEVLEQEFENRDKIGTELVQHVKDGMGAVRCEFSVWYEGQLWDISVASAKINIST